MNLNEQAEQAISKLLESFPITTSDEVLSFARQAWYAGYGTGMDWMRDELRASFARLHEAS